MSRWVLRSVNRPEDWPEVEGEHLMGKWFCAYGRQGVVLGPKPGRRLRVLAFHWENAAIWSETVYPLAYAEDWALYDTLAEMVAALGGSRG